MQHACVFCEKDFLTLEKLAAHLWDSHNHAVVQIGEEKREFKVYRHTGQARVLCFCKDRFTSTLLVAPFFTEWAIKNIGELNSFVAHLRREGGLAAHLKKLKDQALIEKIAGSCQEISSGDDASYPNKIGRLVRKFDHLQRFDRISGLPLQ